MKAKEIRSMSSMELNGQLETLKGELFNLRFQQATGQLENVSRIRVVKRNIARVKTVMHEKNMKAQGE
ncbi:MAG: 50S ribosomal protein L29 [Tissierellia bacterium]|nr:50S ribosomal protein L29 [Bacillota bacterium]NLL23373.1 50S ribosomal protein L29 [Tissierellia bacterium]